MDYKEIFDKINIFSGRLQDRESEQIFNARIKYLIYRNREMFYQDLDEVFRNGKGGYGNWRLNQYNARNPRNRDKGIIIFGAGECGKLTCRSLLYEDKKVCCLCDSNEALWGTAYKGIPVCGLSYARQHFKDSIVVVASIKYQLEMYHQLILAGFNETDILMPPEGYLYCDRGNQYFDLPELKSEPGGEYFVDAGCYDGMTSLQCSKWCGGNLKMVYAFEPGSKNYTECDGRLSQVGCEYELYECAAWSKETTLYFHYLENAGFGSAVRSDGEICVKADSIDNKLNGRKATYIKYDVEGSELEALRGSVNTILTYRPKLAISIYHKPEDVIDIPVFLEGLDLGYRYYLRQYQTRMEETTLYAI